MPSPWVFCGHPSLCPRWENLPVILPHRHRHPPLLCLLHWFPALFSAFLPAFCTLVAFFLPSRGATGRSWSLGSRGLDAMTNLPSAFGRYSYTPHTPHTHPDTDTEHLGCHTRNLRAASSPPFPLTLLPLWGVSSGGRHHCSCRHPGEALGKHPWLRLPSHLPLVPILILSVKWLWNSVLLSNPTPASVSTSLP